MGYDPTNRFFADLEGTTPVRNTFGCEHKPGWTPEGAMKWYDQIIDDMLANPGTDMTATAKRLGRSPSTVHTIAASDLFKARWAQRRAQFEEALNERMVAKITRTAELALDATIEHLEKKRDAVPLPILNELTKTALDRLGYGPKPTAGPAVQVNVSSNVVSAEALEAARNKLRQIEGVVVPSPPVAGPEVVDGEED